ncbi:phasin family protein [Methylocella sp.]|uniref:phasin family protein n=1 Tax=Methylocella sp. TaxID=1978226 RepID=UPI0037847545
MVDANLKVADEALDRGNEAVSKTTATLQSFATECAAMSRQSLDHATETAEKLRQARGVTEMLAIQTQYVRECFENFTQHSRRFAELLAAMPIEMGKTYSDIWSKNIDSVVDASRQATDQAASNVEKFTKTP